MKTIFKIPNASPSDALADLLQMRKKGKVNANKVHMVYDYLRDKVQSSQAGDEQNDLW